MVVTSPELILLRKKEKYPAMGLFCHVPQSVLVGLTDS